MKLFVTGASGYLGSLLVPLLLEKKHDVTGLDTAYFSERTLYGEHPGGFRHVRKDLRQIEPDDLRGHDAIVHMAELSNDPIGELDPRLTFEINHKGTVRIAEMAKEVGVRRFVYMSSCSVYGVASEERVSEESAVNPQTAYAECKTLVERDLKPMADDSFSPTFHRNATAYGASPYQRFDIVLNNLCGLAWTTKEIRMTSDGTPWRPLVHGLDIGRAITRCLEAPIENVHNQVINVGDTDHNYQVRRIAEFVADAVPGCRLSFGDQGADNRSYKVNFDKIKKVLPGFQCQWDARKGARQLIELFQKINFTKEDFEWRGFTRLKQLRHLMATDQIDKDFFWKQPGR